MRFRTFLLALTLLAAGCRQEPSTAQPAAASSSAGPYVQREATRDGTGKVYMGREIARVMGHEGADWLERPDRVVTELPDRVVEALALTPASVVADIGAGTGYFTFRIAPRVPNGTVFAVDIQPEMLQMLERREAELGLKNVRTILGTESDPRLPAASVDVALFVDSYHEFTFPREMMARVAAGLKPGGRVVLVEYRGEDPTVAIKPLHKMTAEQAKREMDAVGLRFREALDVLPQQHLLVFEKPEAPGS